MKKRTKIALIALAVVVVVLLVLQTPLLRVSRDRSWWAVTTVVGRAFGIGPLIVSNNVEEQILRLVAENARLRGELRGYAELRRQVGSPAFADYRALGAIVAPQPFDVLRSRYVLNRGAADGVVVGAPVVVYDSTLVGFIVELGEKTSIVQLSTHPATSFPAELVGGEEPYGNGLVGGRSHTALMMGTIPRDVPLGLGQEVVTLSQDQVVPQGLFAGRVMDILTEEHEPYQAARLELPFDPNRLRAVSILLAQ